MTFTIICVARSYDGPARTRRRRFLRLNDDGDGDRDLDGVLPRDDRGGVKYGIPKKLLGISINLEGVRVTVIYTTDTWIQVLQGAVDVSNVSGEILKEICH